MNMLEQAFQEMSEHTAPVCATFCKTMMPNRCCDPMYCEMAREFASERGITLVPTGHPTLPFMGPTGCTVAPHLRPLCTLHVCCINSLGFKPGDPAWTKRYFELRERIDELTE